MKVIGSVIVERSIFETYTVKVVYIPDGADDRQVSFFLCNNETSANHLVQMLSMSIEKEE